MLRLVILVAVFLLIFYFVYRKIFRVLLFWNSELSDEGLEDKQEKLKIERSNFEVKLKEEEKNIETRKKQVEKLKKGN